MPLRLNKLAKALRRSGVSVEKPKGGSHWKAKRDDVGTYSIPAHNGMKTEIPDVYVKKCCVFFGLDYDAVMGR